MNYGFGKDDVQEINAPFPVAERVSDVVLESCEYSSGDKYEAIDFHWVRTLESGRKQSLRDRAFAVNESTITARPKETIDQAIKNAYVAYNTRLSHIAETFGIDRETLQSECRADTFQEMANCFCEMLMKKADGVKVWLKTLPDKGYVRVPNFPSFIQPMSDGECNLKYSQWELAKIAKESAPSNGVHESTEGENSEKWVNEESF